MYFFYLIISLVTAIVWSLIPFRQYKTKPFYYFYVLGIVGLVFKLFVIIKLNYDIYILGSFLLFIALNDYKFIKKNIFPILILCMSAFFYQFIFKFTGQKIIIFCFLHLLIISRILYLVVVPFFRSAKLNIFYIVLIFYELTVLTKFSNLLSGLVSAYTEFIMANILEIFIGLFFLIYREDNPKLIYHFKSMQKLEI
jgi:hypothetical protein